MKALQEIERKAMLSTCGNCGRDGGGDHVQRCSVWITAADKLAGRS